MRELLFTFVVDYKGGTYVSQVPARTVRDAIKAWPKFANWRAMGIRMSDSFEKRLQCGLSDEEPVLLDGATNVWCICPRLGRFMAIVNIVATIKSRCPVRSPEGR